MATPGHAHQKVHKDDLTEARIAKLKAAGYEYVGPLEGHPDIIRFTRYVSDMDVGAFIDPDDVVLDPAKITAKLRLTYGPKNNRKT